MKVITLIPIRNEEWILDSSLHNISSFSDIIIIADQNSKDTSREICSRYPKVRVLDNPYIGHSNKVRWFLLEEARKEEGTNLIICIDADEALHKNHIDKIKDLYRTKELNVGDFVSFDWIQLWGSLKKHRVDGVWGNNKKTAAFIDDRVADYNHIEVLNDHTDRVPLSSTSTIYTTHLPLLHFQNFFLDQAQIKQAWYRCTELIKNPLRVKKINLVYSVTLPHQALTAEVPHEWVSNISAPTQKNANVWRLKEIYQWFDNYGIEFFEPLDIWYIPELKQEFLKRTGRMPTVKRFLFLLIQLNNIKNKLKSLLK